jgi:2-dehydropantoate 2-reductase
MARVAVVGVGAIGGVIAALLEVAGRHEITLCTRRPLHNLTVKTPDGVVSVKAANVTDPAAAEAVDWVLVATKTYDAQGTSAWFRTLCGGSTRVAVLQNGVEHRERFATAVSPELLLPVIIDCPAERQGDGSVVQRGPAWMYVEANRLGEEFSQLFAGTDARIQLTDDFITAAWRKLCMNAAGVISALLMKPAGVLQDEALGRVVLDIVAECVAVGRAEGARLASDTGQQVLAAYRAQPPDSINSLLADRLAGRQTEIEARNGAIVRKGERHGIDTPSNRMAVALIQALGKSSTS